MATYVALLIMLTVAFVTGENCFNLDTIQLQTFNFTEVYPSLDENQKSSNSSPLYFGLMVAPSEDNQWNKTVTAVRLAVDTINTDSKLLKGYSLHYTLTSPQCFGDLVDKTAAQLFGTPGVCKLGLIEAGCTEKTESLIRTSWVNYFNIPQITCSPTFRDENLLNQIFEIVPPRSAVVPAVVSVVTHYNWTRINLLVEDTQLNVQIIKALGVLESLNVTLNVTLLTANNNTLQTESNHSFFKPDTRIYVVASSSEVARHILCKAYKSNIKYPMYEFLFVSEYDSQWWEASLEDDMHYGCSTEERAQVVNHSLAFQWRLNTLSDKEELLDVNNTKRQALYCFDAILTLALAVNKTISTGQGECRETLAQLHENIKQTSFSGLTGKIAFEENGIRNRNGSEILIQQYHSETDMTKSNLVPVTVGVYKDVDLSLMYETISWPSGVPYDGSPVTVLVTVSLPLVIVYYSIATVGLVFTFICCAFNFIFRKRKVVRLTSPNLNYLFLIGIAFNYLSTYWYCLPSINPDVVLSACCLQLWFISIGYFLAVGTMVAKLWRIYYIFRNPETAKNRTVSDCHLFVFIVVVVTFIGLAMSVYIAVEVGLPGYELSQIPSANHPPEIVGDVGIDTQYVFYTCSRVPNARIIASGVAIGVITIFLVSALFMAFKTRKIKLKGLRDAKYIMAIVYVSTVCDVAIIVITFTLKSHVNSFPAILTGVYMLVATICLGLVFIPKMVSLYQDPKGEHVLDYIDNRHRPPTTQLSKQFSPKDLPEMNKQFSQKELLEVQPSNTFSWHIGSTRKGSQSGNGTT